MAINNLRIENFTVFEEIEVEFSNGINIFIGENGTGKTHLLKILHTLLVFKDKKVFKTRYNNNKECVEGDGPFHNDFGLNYDFALHRNIGKETYAEINHFNNKIPSNFVFIPAKDMLTHSKGLLQMAKKYSKEMPFDKTLLDIIEKSLQWKLDEIPEIAKSVAPKLEKIMDGKIIIENDTFYLEKSDGKKIEFSIEAEGIKKIGLLWQLLMNENITKDTVLIWDEPEANINPKLIPDIVEILLELSRQGVQIFIATHDYIFSKYFEVRRKKEDSILFHSLYKAENGANCETNVNFRDLQNNSIISSFNKLLDEVYFTNTED